MRKTTGNFTFCRTLGLVFVCISTVAQGYDPTSELMSLLDYFRPLNEQQHKQEAELIRQLLRAGANPNARTVYGHIIVAAARGKPEALQALIEAGVALSTNGKT